MSVKGNTKSKSAIGSDYAKAVDDMLYKGSLKNRENAAYEKVLIK